ncbi:MAG: deoxyribodipyrimidine photo-lyase, partial [Solirubrobacteraceae bacterium]|nr:deoxyribodipyrimidine photo-lyase [Solirubrobacteraceae bacterium]
MPSTCLLWLRRDLRVHDHPALQHAHAEFDVVVPVYVFDDALLTVSEPRTAFLLGCLRALDEELGERGAGLVVRRGDPERALAELAREIEATAVLWTTDVAPYARARDRRVTEALRDAGVEPVPCPGTYVRDVSKVRRADGEPFVVFTPYWRAWQQLPARAVHGAPRALAPLPRGLDRGDLPEARPTAIAPGERAAREALRRWLSGPIDRYADAHDTLAGGTSVLSPYLRWGCVSARECEQRAVRRGTAGAEAWVRQLAWRDFFASVLLAHPETLHREFQARYRDLDWHDDPEAYTAWRRGETGFPVIDAAMRQLAETGWMHNRARMLVGSFLTKDLHLDWRLGERHFALLLVDGEPAQNVGNWQWIASTGVDPAPYFRRIFNPALQQRRFDPDGTYVRRWVPELGDVPIAHLAEPWAMTEREQRAAGCVIDHDYPAPIVDHAEERRRAIERYRAV